MIDKLKGFFSGVCFGIATAVPGLSGGTMLVIWGCYDRICEALALDLKAIKKNWLFLIVFAIGLLAGVVGFAHAMTFLIERIPLIVYLALSALILVGLPVVIKKIKAGGDFRALCIIPILLGFALVAVLFIAEMAGAEGAGATTNPVMLLISAMFAGIASIIPGVSGAFVLVMLGVYEPVIIAVKEFDFAILAFVGTGVVLGLVGGSKLITILLKNAQTMVYSAIAGMLAASALMLAIDTIIKYA